MALPGSPREQVCPSVCQPLVLVQCEEIGELRRACGVLGAFPEDLTTGLVACRTSRSVTTVHSVVLPYSLCVGRLQVACDQVVLCQSGPRIRPGYPLNLSISISGGKETNKDSLSNGERSGNSSNLKSPVPAPANCSL